MKNFVFLLTVYLAFAATTFARDLYVNNQLGDDRFDGTSPTVVSDLVGPVRSITKALRIAGKSDQIHLANTGEPYRESITLQGGHHSGSDAVPFVIFGNGATLDGTRPVPDNLWEHHSGQVFRFRPVRLHHLQLFADGKPLKQNPIRPTDPALPELAPLEWALWQGHAYFCTEPGKLPESYQLSSSGDATGITVYQVRNAALLDLTVQGFSVDGINVHDGFGPFRIGGIVSRGNGRSGIAVVGASRVNIEGCLLGANSIAQLLVDGLVDTKVIDCDLVEDAPAYLRKQGRLSIDGNPVE